MKTIIQPKRYWLLTDEEIQKAEEFLEMFKENSCELKLRIDWDQLFEMFEFANRLAELGFLEWSFSLDWFVQALEESIN